MGRRLSVCAAGAVIATITTSALPAGAGGAPFELRYQWPLPDSSAAVVAAAAGPDGDLYVLRNGADVVSRFTYAGEPVGVVGAGTGSGAGQLSGPSAVAVDATGAVFVADTGNKRVVEFGPDGTDAGSWPAGGGGFADPVGVATGGDHVYVLDAALHELLVFDSGGTLLHTLQTGGAEHGVAVDPVDGTVYVSEGSGAAAPTSNRILEFTPGGLALTTLSGFGSGNGELDTPTTITAYGGVVTFFDSGNSRVEQLRGDGTFVRTFGPYQDQVDVGGGGLTTDCTGTLYADTADVVSSDHGIAVLGDPTARIGTCPVPPTRFLGAGVVAGTGGAAVDRAGDVYVSDPASDRIDKFGPDGALVTSWGQSGSAAGRLSGPGGVAVDRTGNVWVADIGNSRVEEFGSAGRFIRAFGGPGTGQGEFDQMGPIAVDPAGDVAVGDYLAGTGGRVQIFSGAGVLERTVTLPAAGLPLTIVTALGVDEKGRFVVVWVDAGVPHFATHRAAVGATGTLTGQVGVPDSTAGATVAGGVGSLSDGTGVLSVQVVSQQDGGPAYDDSLPVNGLMRLGPDGAFRSRTGSDGSSAGQFTAPGQIAVDCADDVYVADGTRVVQQGLRQGRCTWRPKATTGRAAGVKRTAATLAGSVNPSAQVTSWWIQWGRTTAYGHSTAKGSLPSDNRALAVRAALSRLKPHTTYHYRVVATNRSGTVHGRDRTVTTAG